MSRLTSFSTRAVCSGLGLGLASGLGCQGPPERSLEPSTKAVPRALASATAGRVAPAVRMPNALPQAELMGEGHARVEPVKANVKYSGRVGERLEGDVYYFTVLSLRTCDAAGKLAAVEVEIEAKSKLSVSPRDVTLGKGGITFTANLDFKRQPPGCTPRLEISTLQKAQKARGFVLYDLPRPPGPDLRLIYQPTRFGGAGFVTASLQPWSAPAAGGAGPLAITP